MIYHSGNPLESYHYIAWFRTCETIFFSCPPSPFHPQRFDGYERNLSWKKRLRPFAYHGEANTAVSHDTPAFFRGRHTQVVIIVGYHFRSVVEVNIYGWRSMVTFKASGIVQWMVVATQTAPWAHVPSCVPSSWYHTEQNGICSDTYISAP